MNIIFNIKIINNKNNNIKKTSYVYKIICKNKIINYKLIINVRVLFIFYLRKNKI